MPIMHQPRAQALLKKLIAERVSGRTMIFEGGKGSGKFTAAVRLAEELIGRNPFLSPDFLFYRNDDFSVKTRFYFQYLNEKKLGDQFVSYLFYLMGRISLSVAFGEISKSGVKLKKISKGESANVNDFRMELEEALINGKALALAKENEAFRDNLLALSDELTKKKKIPIDFVRSAIEFNSMRGSGYKIILIGNYEAAGEETQNASLKLFEEPSGTTIVLLTTEDTSRLLPTILSRGVRIPFALLAPKSLTEILGLPVPEGFTGTSGFMVDRVYHYTERLREKTSLFFGRIAPTVQHGMEVFSFIEGLADDDAPDFPALFMQELMEFLRLVHMHRQLSVRGRAGECSLPVEYSDLVPILSSQAITSELEEMSVQISSLLSTVRRNNVTPGVVMPSLLIDLARWYQRRSVER